MVSDSNNLDREESETISVTISVFDDPVKQIPFDKKFSITLLDINDQPPIIQNEPLQTDESLKQASHFHRLGNL